MRFLFVFVFFASFTIAQDIEKENGLKKNSFSFNAGSVAVIHGIGLSYQRIFPKVRNLGKFKNASSVVSIGTNIIHSENSLFGITEINRFLIPHISYGLINNIERDHHVEVYIGISYKHETSYSFRSSPNTILPVVKFGYRYQEPKNNLVFTCGIGSVNLLYIGLGYAF